MSTTKIRMTGRHGRLWLLGVLAVLMAVSAHAAVYPITYTNPQAGNVSVSVYDSTGKVVRELLLAAPQPAGEQTIFWDGLDREGNGVPAGSYSWKLLRTNGLSAQYLLSLGSNYPIKPSEGWQHASGPGCHGTPYGVAVDSTGIYIAAGGTENIETCNLKLSLDGATRLWSNLAPRAWDGATSQAVDNGECFMLGHEHPQRVFVYNATSGSMVRAIDVRWDTSDARDATDMDIKAGILVVAYAGKNAIRWYNPTTGALLDTATVTAPQGVTVAADGTVYVTTGSSIFRLTQADHTPMLVWSGLTSPGRIDVEHHTGNMLVYQGGSSQQIVRVSPAGAVLNTYGAAGGRSQGLYTATTKKSFSGFYDLCADGAGGFYITEPNVAPRRTAHLNAAGDVTQEWYGGQRWAPHAQPDPDDPNVVWVGSQYGWVMRCIVDYTTKTWTVHSTYAYKGMANGLVEDSWNEGSFFRIAKRNGVKYLVMENTPTIFKIDEANWRLVPSTICYVVWYGTPQYIKDWGPGKPFFQWNDGNGDGWPQQAEVTFYDTAWPNSFQPTIDANFTCFATQNINGQYKVVSYPVTSWNAVGAPVYGTMPTGTVFADCPPRVRTDVNNDGRWAGFLYHDTVSGRLFGAYNPGTLGWCSSFDSFLQTWNSTGTPAWAVGQPGAPISANLRGFAGVTHDCVVAVDVNGGWSMSSLARTYVWDQDGLLVGGIMDNPDLNGIPNFMYQLSGELCHSALYTLPNGDVYFYGNWENEVRVYKVTGWNNWQRQNGSLTVTTPSASGVGQGLVAEYFDNNNFTDLRTKRVDGPVNFNWGSGIPSGTTITSADTFSVRWRGMLRTQYGPSYVGGWWQGNEGSTYEGAFMQTSNGGPGEYATFTFPGTSVSLIGRTGPVCGTVDIYLDGVFQQRRDCYGAADNYTATLFQASGLAAGDHTLLIKNVYGVKNAASSGYWICLDRVIVDGGISIDDAGVPYTFYALADDGAELWLNGGKSLLGDWSAKTTATELGSTSKKMWRSMYPVELYFNKGTGNATAGLYWSSPLQAKQLIPASALFPYPVGQPIPVQVQPSGCVFVGTNTTTQGNWKGVFGQDGCNIIGDGASYPGYATVIASDCVGWSDTATTDVRALQKRTGTDRIFAKWQNNGSTPVSIDLYLTDGQWHQVSIYAVDWQNMNAAMRIEVLDNTGQVLDTQNVSSFQNGKYLTWKMKGQIRFRITSTNWGVILNGLFFDPTSGTPATPATMNITGLAQAVPDGSNAPLVINDTDFGTQTVGASHDHVFTIANGGTTALNLSGTPKVSVSGAHAGDFTVTAQPASPVAGKGQTTFTVRFTPSAAGTRSARLSITNDSSQAPYDFAIQGNGLSSFIIQEYWLGFSGGISTIPVTQPPTGTYTLQSLEGPSDWADNYGSRIRGYITAPSTGSYTFWLASDNNGELWLSTNDQPSSKGLIASVPDWTYSRQWNKYSSQKSAAITLTAGQRYYVEVLQIEGAGGDNVAVGWAKPGQSTTAPSEVVPGSALSPYLASVAAPSFSPAPGTYTSTQSVSITCATSGTTIRYTTDGSTPSETVGTVYSSPVSISSTNTLKAIAYKAGMPSSTITSGLYTITGTPVAQINCGGPAVSPFVADTGYSGGSTYYTTHTINTAGVTNPAPMAVYQTMHNDGYGGSLSYTIGGLTANASYRVRLHFAEAWATSAGVRVFTTWINGTQVLTNYDIFADVGHDVAVVKEFTTTANANGQVVITQVASANIAQVNGIEVISGN